MPALESCRCCSEKALLERGVCPKCAHRYGPRVAQLLARCQVDADFTSACLARLPEPTRQRFAAALGAKCLIPSRGPGVRYTRAAVAPHSAAKSAPYSTIKFA